MVTFKGTEIIIVGLSNVPNLSYSEKVGPFWEPGAYQIYLNIALILVLFNKNIKDKNKLIFL